MNIKFLPLELISNSPIIEHNNIFARLFLWRQWTINSKLGVSTTEFGLFTAKALSFNIKIGYIHNWTWSFHIKIGSVYNRTCFFYIKIGSIHNRTWSFHNQDWFCSQHDWACSQEAEDNVLHHNVQSCCEHVQSCREHAWKSSLNFIFTYCQ